MTLFSHLSSGLRRSGALFIKTAPEPRKNFLLRIEYEDQAAHVSRNRGFRMLEFL
jgi:hypothetical protein